MAPETYLTVFLIVLTALNAFVFILFARDKNAARKNVKRTSERTLIFLALLGPFGAYGAMKVFQHKTQKIKFFLIPLFAILHIVILMGFLVYQLE